MSVPRKKKVRKRWNNSGGGSRPLDPVTWRKGKASQVDNSPIARSILSQSVFGEPRTVKVRPPCPKDPAACPDGPAFELYRLLSLADNPRYAGRYTGYAEADLRAGEIRRVPTVVNAMWASYGVALETLKEHEDDSSPHKCNLEDKETGSDRCPRCTDAHTVISQTEAALETVKEALECDSPERDIAWYEIAAVRNNQDLAYNSTREAARAGIMLFEAGLAAGRLQAWPAESAARQTISCHDTRVENTTSATHDAVQRKVKEYLAKNTGATRSEIYDALSEHKPATIRKYAEDLLPPSRTRRAKKK